MTEDSEIIPEEAPDLPVSSLERSEAASDTPVENGRSLPRAPLKTEADLEKLKTLTVDFIRRSENNLKRRQLQTSESDLLLPQPILAFYQNLPPNYEPTKLRTLFIDRALEVFERMLSDCTRRIKVETLWHLVDASSKKNFIIRPTPAGAFSPVVPQRACFVTHDDFVLLEHQILAARRWGIGFSFSGGDEENEIAYYVEGLWQNAIRALSSQVTGITSIERQLSKSAKWAAAEAPKSDIGFLFEEVICDILNERAIYAQRAKLVEDILECTDLRVRLPGLSRSSGARVQISLSNTDAKLAVKRSNIPLSNEVVVLSPVSLAEYACKSSEGQSAVREALHADDSSPSGLAKAIARHFSEILRANSVHPWGPAGHVSRTIRALVQEFVKVESERTTQELREREQKSGGLTFRERKLLERREKQTAEKNAFDVGAILKCEVTGMEGDVVNVVLPDGKEGRVVAKNASWEKANLLDLFEVGKSKLLRVLEPYSRTGGPPAAMGLKQISAQGGKSKEKLVSEIVTGEVVNVLATSAVVKVGDDAFGLLPMSELGFDSRASQDPASIKALMGRSFELVVLSYDSSQAVYNLGLANGERLRAMELVKQFPIGSETEVSFDVTSDGQLKASFNHELKDFEVELALLRKEIAELIESKTKSAKFTILGYDLAQPMKVRVSTKRSRSRSRKPSQ
jgi:hypothetical protein